MEMIFTMLTYIEQFFELTVGVLWDHLIDFLVLPLTISILFDDLDVLNAMNRIKSQNFQSKVKERNEMFEAIASTKGAIYPIIEKKRNIIIFPSALLIILIENLSRISLPLTDGISFVAVITTCYVKGVCNKNYKRLKRDA